MQRRSANMQQKNFLVITSAVCAVCVCALCVSDSSQQHHVHSKTSASHDTNTHSLSQGHNGGKKRECPEGIE